VVGALVTFKPTDSDTLILEPYYGNEENASGSTAAGPNHSSGNARWNAILAYYTHDFNDQTQPHALSMRVRGEIFEDQSGARTCIGGNNFNGGTNVCAGGPGGFLPANAAGVVVPGGFNVQTGGGVPQTLWETTWTLQYKPAPALMTRVEYRYDHSNKNVFLDGDTAKNNQSTLSFSVVYLF
jgi:opacity protein-like surface antigen